MCGFDSDIFPESKSKSISGVLYVLICNGCKEYYIGKTGDKLMNRKTVHEQQIRDPSTSQMPVSKHIDNCCETQPMLSIFLFYKFQTDVVSVRLAKERYFIYMLSPKLNIFHDVTIYTYLRTHICVHMCTHILLMTSLGNCNILMTLQI